MAATSSSSLVDRIKQAESLVEIGARYYHYKNQEHTYKVIALAVQEADESICVVYQAEYGDNLTFTRPLESWLDELEIDGEHVARFSRVKS